MVSVFIIKKSLKGDNLDNGISNKIEENAAWNKVLLARNINRLRSLDIITSIFKDFIELHGDRKVEDDKSMVCGVALLDDCPVTIISQQKGRGQTDMEYRQYGMNKPSGYRKALRLMKQAEKFKRPIICFIDTPGAYPGVSAEKNGQAEAIASNLCEMFNIEVPIISIIIGEGGSGGALAISVANKIIMLENAIFSVVSPEGCASILFKDSKKAPYVAESLRLTANDLKELNIIDEIISEEGGNGQIIKRIKESIVAEIRRSIHLSGEKLREERFKKYRMIGGNIQFN